MKDDILTQAQCETVAAIVTSYNATYHTCAPGYWESLCNSLQALRDLGILLADHHYWTEPPALHFVGGFFSYLETYMNVAIGGMGYQPNLEWVNAENLRRIGQIVLTYPYVRSSHEFLAAASP